MKVQAESFHLNGHIIGFRPHTQKLESPYKPPSNTLAVKGLSSANNNFARASRFFVRFVAIVAPLQRESF